MYYQLNEEGEIISTCDQPMDGFLYTDKEIVWSYNEERLLFKEQTETEGYKAAETEYHTKKQKDDIRRQRQQEFALYLDRSPLFYSELTEEQLTELKAWREAWKNAPETLEIPTRPDWLK